MAESSKRGFSLPPESKSKKTCSEIDICGHVYNSDEDYDDISDQDLSGSCSSTSVDLTDEETVTSEGSSISMMDDGPCDYVSKDGTKWWNEPPSDFHQDEYFSKDFQPQLVGPSMESDTFGDFFKLFFTHELCSYILSQTNNKLESHLSLNQVPNPQKKYLYAITLEELYTFLGMMILFGVFRSSKEKISNLYSDDPNLCRPIIKCSMPRDRFKVILRFLRFDDASTRLERTLQDKLAPIRFVFDSINTTLSKTYTPGKWLTVDEHMTGYRGRCPILQFMPAKPDKYGIKIFILADAKTYFPCAMEAYTGSKSYIANKPNDIVLRLCSSLGPGHFVAGDNFFTSKMLSDQLLTKYKTYYMGMLRKNRREIPKEMKDTKGVSIHSSRFLYTQQGYNTLISYMAKKTKNVLILSNIHRNEQIPNTKNPKCKPSAIFDYNKFKCGVDKNNQMIKEFRSHRIIRRWPCVLFFDLIGEVALSSWILYCLKYPNEDIVQKKDRRQFLYLLGSVLVLPSIISRQSSTSFQYYHKHLKTQIQSIAQSSTLPVEHQVSSIVPSKRGRCYLCERGRDMKRRSVCSNCQKHICEIHSKVLTFCERCQEDISFFGSS